MRGAKAHPLGALPDAVFADVCERLNQIIRLA
jgi:mRNA interferase MazF